MRRRVVVLTALIVAVVVILLVGPGVGFYTDILWYSDTGFRSLYLTELTYQTFLFIGSSVLFAVVLGVNVFLARKLSPLRPLAITNDFLFNLRRTVDPVLRLVLAGVVIVGAVAFGSAAVGMWKEFLLWSNSQPFDVTDPVFGRDVSFYVFSLPVWEFVFGWLFVALVITLIAVAAVYAYAGAIGPQPEGGYLAPQPRTHLSILLGLILLLKALGYQLDQWRLLYSTRGVVTGASYTDVNAQLPAYRVLFWIAIVSALLLFATFLTKRLVLPIVAIALMAVAAFVVGGVYPRLVQQFQVVPNEIEKEAPYIERNIEFTRQAYGLDQVVQQPFPYDEQVTAQEVQDNEAVLRNVRLWDDKPLLDSYKQTQELVPYYQFQSIGVDRYEVGDKTTQVLVSPREVDPTQLSEQARTWQNEHLVYTHGFGVVASPANSSTRNGGPDYLVQNLPPQTAPDARALEIAEPRIYFGERTQDFIIVKTTLSELDRPVVDEDTRTVEGELNVEGESGGGVEAYRYQGDNGVQLDSWITRLAFAVKFRDAKFVLSDAILPESRLLYDRAVDARLQKIAPFLTFDRNRYMTVIDGQLNWVVDAYTTTSLYPYSEPPRVTQANDLAPFFGDNYARNSVTAVVNAYSGEVTLYRVDKGDPIAAAWDQAIPGLFENEEPSETLKRHLRYPIDLFQLQSQQYGRYHITNPREFYSQEDVWEVSLRSSANPASPTTVTDVPVRPQYLNMRLPGEAGLEFTLFNSYTPREKRNLISMLAARSNPEQYGELVSLVLPRGAVTINGPQQVEARIQQDPEISREISLLDQRGSRTERGIVRIVPIADSLLYVQPIYLRADENAVPQLAKVVVMFGNTPKMGNSFADALTKLIGTSPVPFPAGTGPSGAEGGETPSQASPEQQVADLVAVANSLYGQMQEALGKGDLETYGRLEKQLGDTLGRLQALSGLGTSQPQADTGAGAETAPTTTAAGA